ncbi:hypothetical protein Hanom_Chr17g01544061 [Helianthus anomalus]
MSNRLHCQTNILYGPNGFLPKDLPKLHTEELQKHLQNQPFWQSRLYRSITKPFSFESMCCLCNYTKLNIGSTL